MAALLAVADLHDEEVVLEKLRGWVESVEGILIAGDITGNNRSYAEDLLEVVGDRGFFVPGNNEEEEIIKFLDPINIHGKRVGIGPYRVVGFGYSNITPFHTPGDRDKAWWEAGLSRLEIREGDILMTHVPPKGILDKTSSGARVGCEALREFVEDKPFSLHIFGHVHERVGFALYKRKAFINLPPAFSLQGLLIEGEEWSIVRL